jgi:hypothetical protein
VSLENAPDAHVEHAHTSWDQWRAHASIDYVVGIALALVQTLLSGFGAIYFEKVTSSPPHRIRPPGSLTPRGSRDSGSVGLTRGGHALAFLSPPRLGGGTII